MNKFTCYLIKIIYKKFGGRMKKIIAVLVTLLILAVSCSKDTGKSDDNKYNAFWSYFKSVESKTGNIENLSLEEQGKLLDEIKIQLSKIDSNLNVELSGKNKELIITADGIIESFSEAQNLVNSAPKDLGWKVIAFKQRKALPFSLKFDDSFTVDTTKIFFSVKENGEHLDIQVYFDGQEMLQEIQKKQVIYTFLDGIIGEYDTEMYIGAIDSSSQKDESFITAEDFLKRTDDFKNKIKPNKK